MYNFDIFNSECHSAEIVEKTIFRFIRLIFMTDDVLGPKSDW